MKRVPLLLLFMMVPAASAAPPPNILLIMTDDQGLGDLGVTGNTVLDTPRINTLAAQSASLARFYVSPVCTPTRASLMTGRYNYRTRAIDTYRGRAMMEPDEVTIAEILRQAGYATGIFGKWHLGDCYPMRPIDQGFERAVVHKGGGLAQPADPLENDRRYTDAILFDNGVQFQSEGFCTDVYVDHAIEFMEQAHAEGRPFFAYVATNAPHGPFHDVPTELHAKYAAMGLADRQARIFAMIENIDTNVGRLLDALDRMHLAHDTIVVYLHDNGPNGDRYNVGLRDHKGSVYEGGIRSPLFVRWPGRLEPGTVVQEIGAHIDVLPTLLDAADVPVPESVDLDGRSLLPLLEQREVAWPERVIVIQAHRGDVPDGLHNFAVIEQRWKLLRASGFGRETAEDLAQWELFDLYADAGEEHDVIGENVVETKRLVLTYWDWFNDVSRTRPDNYAPPRIVIGSKHERSTVLTRQDWRATAGDDFGQGGLWKVRMAEAGPYRARVILDRTIESSRAVVRLGNRSWSADLPDPCDVFDILMDDVEPGDADLEVIVTTEETVVPPYHVIVEQVVP